MSRLWWAYALLLGLALAIGLAAGGPGGADWVTPSTLNNGPKGLGVLATWLQESRVSVERGVLPLTQLPPDIRSVVIPAPAARAIDEAEVEALRTFVRHGGTLVYLASRTKPQPAVDRWLHVTPGPMTPLVDAPDYTDLGGSTLEVLMPAGLLASAKAIRVQLDTTVLIDDPAAVAMTKPAGVWFVSEGEGEVWVVAGPDLAENGRLAMLDNATFWSALAARGPVWVDEYHHVAADAPVIPASVKSPLLQLLLVGGLSLFVWGRRQGPPRPTLAIVHRQTLETAEAQAALTQRLGFDAELAQKIAGQTLTSIRQRLGLADNTATAEIVAAATERWSLAPGSLDALLATPADLLRVSQATATLPI